MFVIRYSKYPVSVINQRWLLLLLFSIGTNRFNCIAMATWSSGIFPGLTTHSNPNIFLKINSLYYYWTQMKLNASAHHMFIYWYFIRKQNKIEYSTIFLKIFDYYVYFSSQCKLIFSFITIILTFQVNFIEFEEKNRLFACNVFWMMQRWVFPMD